MIDLQKISGLPIELTDDYKIKFNAPLKEVVPSLRTFADMTPVWMDKNAKPKPETKEMYYMYRDVHLPEHEDLIRKNNLRYDLTVLPPIMIGAEFNKTLGHYHPLVPGKNLAYPELYEVLEGQALFLIQKMDEVDTDIADIQAIKVNVGDKIIYPPGYGHAIFNIGKGPLVTANWSADNFKSLYEPIKKMAGMAYYVLSDGQGGLQFVLNPRYDFVPPIKLSNTEESGRGMSNDGPVYLTAMRSVENLKFLNNPEVLIPD